MPAGSMRGAVPSASQIIVRYRYCQSCINEGTGTGKLTCR